MKRAEVVDIIKKGGGSFAASVTKAVTHLIVAGIFSFFFLIHGFPL